MKAKPVTTTLISNVRCSVMGVLLAALWSPQHPGHCAREEEEAIRAKSLSHNGPVYAHSVTLQWQINAIASFHNNGMLQDKMAKGRIVSTYTCRNWEVTDVNERRVES